MKPHKITNPGRPLYTTLDRIRNEVLAFGNLEAYRHCVWRSGESYRIE